MSEEVKPTVEITPGEFELFLKEKGIISRSLGIDKNNVEMIDVEAKDLTKACEFLKKEKDFDFLNLITSVETKKGFQSVYLIESLKNKTSLRIKVSITRENPAVPSLSHIFKSADWYERESYDMMGITYLGHPNLKRILNPDNWEGFPLRKDYIPPSDALNGQHPLSEREYVEKTLK